MSILLLRDSNTDHYDWLFFSMMWYMECKFTANAGLSVHIITWYPNAACFGGNHTVMCIVSRCWASAFCKEKPWHSGGKVNGTAYSNGKFCGEKSAICRKVEQYHFPGHHAQTFKQNNAFACVLHFCTGVNSRFHRERDASVVIKVSFFYVNLKPVHMNSHRANVSHIRKTAH